MLTEQEYRNLRVDRMTIEQRMDASWVSISLSDEAKKSLPAYKIGFRKGFQKALAILKDEYGIFE